MGRSAGSRHDRNQGGISGAADRAAGGLAAVWGFGFFICQLGHRCLDRAARDDRDVVGFGAAGHHVGLQWLARREPGGRGNPSSRTQYSAGAAGGHRRRDGAYLGDNLVFHGVLPVEGVLQAGERMAKDVLFLLLGPAGLFAMDAVLAISVLGAINSDLLLGPRITFAMGRDGLFFRSLGHIHPKYRTPAVAIVVQSAMAVTLVLASGLLVEFNDDLKQQSVFDLLTNYVIFAVSIFYALAVASVIVLRWKHPEWPRPYRTWGYPFVPLAFAAAYAWFLHEVYWAQPVEARSGLVFLALGIPAYFAMRAFNRRQAASG